MQCIKYSSLKMHFLVLCPFCSFTFGFLPFTGIFKKEGFNKTSPKPSVLYEGLVEVQDSLPIRNSSCARVTEGENLPLSVKIPLSFPPPSQVAPS